MKYIISAALIFVANFVAFGQRPVRFEVKVPSMNCEECEQIIQDKLWKRVDGIVEIDAKWKAKKVVIKFIPDRVDSTNLKLMIADLGFDASDELADETAMKRLPECCRRVVKPKTPEPPKVTPPPATPQKPATPTTPVTTKPSTPRVPAKPVTPAPSKPVASKPKGSGAPTTTAPKITTNMPTTKAKKG